MPDGSVEFAEFATRLSKEAMESRKALPEPAQKVVYDIIEELVLDPTKHRARSRPISRDGRILLYAHPTPPLEITYEIATEEKVIYFLHFAAPVIEPRKLVFISYSHKDEKWLLELKDWLKPLERRNEISLWDDSKIGAGSDWKAEIEKSLASARAAILLVSQNFIASDFIASNELPQLLEAAKTRGVTILWIAVSESAVEATDIVKYQAAMKDPARPLDSLKRPDRNKEFKHIFNRIREALES